MKHEENEFDTSSGSWLLSFVLGGLIGAAVALLVAPRSGRQTREQIKDLAEDAKERAEEYYDKAKSRISTAMQKADVGQLLPCLYRAQIGAPDERADTRTWREDAKERAEDYYEKRPRANRCLDGYAERGGDPGAEESGGGIACKRGKRGISQSHGHDGC